MPDSDDERMADKPDRDADDDDDAVYKCLNLVKIKDRYRHFQSIEKGYGGLTLFLLFMFCYCYVIGLQHRAEAVGGANNALQIYFEKLKADIKCQDPQGIFAYMSKSVLPNLLKQTWTNTSSHGVETAGRSELGGHYHVVGGVMLTAVKRQSHNCFRGQPCYEHLQRKDPFYEINAEDGNNATTYSVPYSHEFGGYTVIIPTASTPKMVSTLLTTYAGLFGPDTEEVWLHTMLFNPSGSKTVTNLGFGGVSDVYGSFSFLTDIRTVSYYFYQPQRKWRQIVAEIFAICFALRVFIYPIYVFKRQQPRMKLVTSEMQPEELKQMESKWIAWAHKWQHLPLRGGQPILGFAIALYSSMGIAVLYYAYLGYLMTQMSTFGSANMDFLFQDPLEGYTDTGFTAEMADSIVSKRRDLWPFIDLVHRISTHYTWYYLIQAAIMTLMILRLQQYLAFQKRLSAVRDTFSGIMDDMMHIGFILLLVCFFTGVLNCLAFGLYDPGFQEFPQAFMEMLLLCFALYKPSASTPFVPSMFKYVPHTMSDVAFMKVVPLLLAVLFKTLVVLLLFKLLMGVIMEGYKKHNKERLAAHTVRDDLVELGRHVYHYVWGHLVRGEPYVSFFHIAIACGSHKEDPDAPWEKYFLGFDHPQKIEKALNGVLEQAEAWPHLQYKMRKLGKSGDFGKDQRDFVLKYYGIPYARAESLFSVQFREDIQKEMQKNSGGESPSKGKPKAAAITGDQEDEISARLQKAQQRLIQKRKLYTGEKDDRSHLELEVIEPWKPSELKKSFDSFDIMKLGTIRHIYVPLLFNSLGIDLPPARVAHMLAKHDVLDDGEMDFAEFTTFMKDKAIIDKVKGGTKADMKVTLRGTMSTNVAKVTDPWAQPKSEASTLRAPLLPPPANRQPPMPNPDPHSSV